MPGSAISPTHPGTGREPWLPLAVVMLLAAALRVYRLGAPLWLDELYAAQLASRGLQGVLQNSWVDAHPPGYYLIQWLLSDFGRATSEIAWRWLPALCGTVAILATWKAMRSISSRASTLAAGVVFATLPSLVYFSQEARPYAFLTLMASLSTWLVIALLTDGQRRLWSAWVLVSLAGLYAGYAYVMVAAIQAFVLGYRHIERGAWWRSYLSLLATGTALVPTAISSLRRVDALSRGSDPLTLWTAVQTLLAGDQGRYAWSWAHIAMPVLACLLLFFGAKRALRLRERTLAFVLIQSVLPLVLYFGVASPLGAHLPLFEAKQFIVLLPGAFVLLAGGLDELMGHAREPRARTGLAITLCIMALAANMTGLARYWAIPKSPEGVLATRVLAQLEPDDAVVSLHYRLDYAANFYLTRRQLYVEPQPGAGTFVFRTAVLDGPFAPRTDRSVQTSLRDLRAGHRFWILAHATLFRETIAPLTEGCRIAGTESQPPFEAMLVACG